MTTNPPKTPRETVVLDRDKLKNKRAEKGWTQEDLEEKSGVPKRTIQNAESGKPVNLHTANDLAETLGCSVADLKPTAPTDEPPEIEITIPQKQMIRPGGASRQRLWVSLALAGLLVLALFALYLARQSSSTATLPPPLQLTSHNAADTFRPVVNLPALLAYRQDIGDVDSPDGQGGRKLNWTGIGVSRNRDKVDAALAQLKRDGVQGVVWFLFSDGGATPNFDANGAVVDLDSAALADYQAAVELTTMKHGLSLIWCIIDHQFMFPAKQVNEARLFGHADVIEDDTKRQQFFQKALLPLLRLFPHNERISFLVVNEPEVALEQAYVTEEKLSLFIREAMQHIRETTRQRVSVSHRTLEALLKFRQDHRDINYDFYNFHHYATYLPPDVATVRKRLGAAEPKPIYWGEFNLNTADEPTLAWTPEKFVNYARRLGYAGVWPWALKPKDDALRFAEVAQVAGFTEKVREQARAVAPHDWLEEARHNLAEITRQVAEWQSELAEKENQITVNREMASVTQQRIATYTVELEREQRKLAERETQHSKNKTALSECQSRIATMQARGNYAPKDLKAEKENERRLTEGAYGKGGIVTKPTGGSALSVDQAKAEVNRKEAEIEKQKSWLKDYERNVRLNEYQVSMTRFRLDLARLDYLPYWQEEASRAAVATATVSASPK